MNPNDAMLQNISRRLLQLFILHPYPNPHKKVKFNETEWNKTNTDNTIFHRHFLKSFYVMFSLLCYVLSHTSFVKQSKKDPFP